jgi:CspA family cold shock protein
VSGARIRAMVQRTPRGVQAVQVLSIEPPATEPMPAIADLCAATPEEISRLPLLPARVKWFDKAKGFGFANVFGNPEDVFIHVEMLRRSGFADLAPGEAVCLRVIDGRRGRMAVQVLSWESAMRAHTDGHTDGRMDGEEAP